MPTAVLAARGAIAPVANTPTSIYGAAKELAQKMAAQNGFGNGRGVIVVIASATPDLDAAFPATGIRYLAGGWETVPLFGTQELGVVDALQACIRLLVLYQGDNPPSHVYLGDAAGLREVQP